MLRLILIICAGLFLYNLGQKAAATPANPNAQLSAWMAVAHAGEVWVARQVHEQTAWAENTTADASAEATVQGLTIDVEPVAPRAPRRERPPAACCQRASPSDQGSWTARNFSAKE